MTENQSETIVSAVICDYYDPELLEEKVAEAVALAGGWPEKIGPEAKVLLNPNLLTSRPPEEAVTTHPELVRAVIKELRKAGVEDITMGDSPANDRNWEELWEITGIKEVAETEKVKLIRFDEFTRIEVPEVGVVPILKGLDTFDVVISLPKLKTHTLTKITAAVKNTYGLIVGDAKSGFHGEFPSPKKMGEFLAVFYGHVKPDLVIMDAIVAMEGQGPGNGPPYHAALIMAGKDAVAVDSWACSVYDYLPEEIPLLVKTAELGLGCADRSKIERAGDGWEVLAGHHAQRSRADFLHRLPEPLFKFLTLLLACRPRVDQQICVKCGACKDICSQNAILVKNKRFVVSRKKCILCMCCMETCPHHAIDLSSPLVRLMNFFHKK